jgi:hypothetical protein
MMKALHTDRIDHDGRASLDEEMPSIAAQRAMATKARHGGEHVERAPHSSGFAAAITAGLQLDRGVRDDEDASELHELAHAGTRGGGSPLPHLDRIQAAFGHHDVTGVRAHIGAEASAATGAMGAHGFAFGDAVAFATTPNLRLAAHEAAHVVQQRGGVRLSGGVGRAGDEYECHADAVADLVVRGESAQGLLDERAHRGARGGPAVQRDEQADRAWVATLRREPDGHYTAADGRELTPRERARLERILSGRGATRPLRTRSESVEGFEAEDVEHVDIPLAHTSVDDEREAALIESGSSHGRDTGGSDSAHGGSTRRARGRGRWASHEDTVDETRAHAGTSPTTLGESVERHVEGTRTEAALGPTLEAGVEARLQAQRRQATRVIRRGPRTRAAEEARERIAEIDRDLAALARPGITRAQVTQIAERHEIRIVLDEHMTTTTETTDVNPLDGSIGAGTHRERTDIERDGTARSSSEHDSVRVDLAEGAVEVRHDEEHARTTADGSSSTGRSSTSHRGSIGDGRIDYAHTRGVEATREGGSEDSEGRSRSRETTTGGGLILGEDESGVSFGRSTRHEATADGTTTASESSTAVQVTDHGVGASHSRDGEIRRGDSSVRGHVAADGSFSIDVTPIDDGSGRFRLTFTIHAGGSIEGSASHRRESGGGARASATLRGTASADVVMERILSEEDAQRYLRAAEERERGHAPHGIDEFDALARLRAAGEEAGTLLNGGALVDSAAARSMGDGDSVTLDTTVGGGGDLSAGTSSIGGEVGGDAHWRRIVQIERLSIDGHAMVRVTVTYANDSSWHAGATGELPPVAARGRHAETDSTTDTVQFVLDPVSPSYDQHYTTIVRTTDRTELRALQRRYAGEVRSSTHATSGTTQSEVEVGPSSSLLVGESTRETHGDSIETMCDAAGNPVGIRADVSGTAETDLRARVAGHDVDLLGHRESMHGTYDPESGARLDVESDLQYTDPTAALGDAGRALADADGAREVATLVAAHSPAEHLQNLFQQFNHTVGYHLDEHALTTFAERAHDLPRWRACCTVPDSDVLAAWTSLAAALGHPRVDPAQARIDPGAATNIARFEAIRAWITASHGHGVECLERAFRRWGESVSRDADPERVAAGYEWPVSLRHERTSYTTLVGEAGGLRARLEQALTRPNGDEEARVHVQHLSNGLADVATAVTECRDITSESRRSELLREIEQHRTEVSAEYRDFTRRWESTHTMCGETPTSEAIEGSRATESQRGAATSRAEIDAGLRVLGANHARETEMLQRIQAILRDDGEPLGFVERANAAEICNAVHDLHRTWFAQIQAVRDAYTRAGIDREWWQVSSGPGTERVRHLEPNVGWLIIEYRRAMEGGAELPAAWQGRIRQWREEAGAY